MKDKEKIMTGLVLLTLFGITMAPSLVVAFPTNNEHNYRGTLTISIRTLNFLRDIPKKNIRFALWDGNNWIELPFWIIENSPHTAYVDMNNTVTTGQVVHSEKLSFNDYFLVVIPNRRGKKV